MGKKYVGQDALVDDEFHFQTVDHREIPANFLRSLPQKTSVYMTNPRRNITMFLNEIFMLTNEENLYITVLDDSDDWRKNVRDIVLMKRGGLWRPRNRLLFLSKNPSDEMVVRFGDWACKKYFALNLAFLNLDSDIIIKYNPFNHQLIRTRDVHVIFEDITKDLHDFQLRISMFSYFLSEWDGENI
ncbi:uncharacterized protein LOC143199893 [Rhynchophorus ferrugineus]|uniref:uncharacterized protein LOC143199893 n=1 Tax=Rhynchophorus ferrugineus TaxID=354439 RepID=UPI003FCC3171